MKRLKNGKDAVKDEVNGGGDVLMRSSRFRSDCKLMCLGWSLSTGSDY